MAAIDPRLSRVKDRVGHGNWLPWVRKNFDWSDDTARRYIDIYEFSRDPKFRSLRNLPVEALYLLARKNVTPEVHTVIAQRVERGEKITPQQVRLAITSRPIERQQAHIYISERPESPPPRSPKLITAEDLQADGDEPASLVAGAHRVVQLDEAELTALRSANEKLTRDKQTLQNLVDMKTAEIEKLEARIAELQAKGTGDMSVSEFQTAIKKWEDTVETQRGIIARLENENAKLRTAHGKS